MGRTIMHWSDGAYVVRQSGVRMDPTITPGERRFDRFLDQLSVAGFWLIAVPGTAIGFYWALTEGLKLVYSIAVSHPFFH